MTEEHNGLGFDDSPLATELLSLRRRENAVRVQEVPLPNQTRIITISNQKGGVGKTTTTVNLASALARFGAKVLVVDLDPQGNASTALNVEHKSGTPSIYEVILGELPLSSVIQQSPESENLFCAPSTIDLAGAEIELVQLSQREYRLALALREVLQEQKFHYIFVDCPPSLGLLTINAFTAASEVLIPIQCEYYALEGLSQLLGNINLIRENLNPRLHLSTILLTMYDGRTRLSEQVAQEVREHFPQETLTTVIPRSVRVSEAPSHGLSVIGYDPTSAGAISYKEAAAEIAKKGA